MKNYVMFYGGIFVIIISCIILWRHDLEKRITERNEIVTVEVIEAPENCGNLPSRGGYCKLKFNNEIFSKKAGNKFCNHVSGKKTTKMLTNKSKDIIIFIDEYDKTELFYGLLLLALGLYTTFYHKIHKNKLKSK